MRTYKALIAFLLVISMLLMLVACGQSETSDNGSDTGTPAGQGGEENEIDYGEEEEEEMSNIEFWYFDLRMTGSDFGDRIEEAVNAITEEKINTHVNIEWITVGDFATKFTLAMSGGDTIDVTQLFTYAKLATLYANNQLLDITDYLNEYAPETMELMADYIGSYTYDGRIYGVPTYRNFCTNGYIIMRKDILEEIGMLEQAQNLTSWSGFEEIMAAVTEQYGGSGLYAVCKGAGRSITPESGHLMHGDNFTDLEIYDTLGDNMGVVYLGDDGKVELYQAQPEYEEECQLMKTWFDNGWIYPDSAMVDTHGDELLKQGVSFATIQGSEIGVETVKGASCGYELVCPMYYTGMIKTSNLTSWGLGVPITAQDPAAACKFINLLYTDAELMNLITWGQEGTDYTIVDDQVQHVEDGHYYEADFLIGNNLLLTPLYGNGADFYERVEAVVTSAELSPYLGFSLDTTDLDLVLSQISAVTSQYSGSMNCGLYTESEFDEYLSKLESAGVYDYLDAIQTQLDAWLAAN